MKPLFACLFALFFANNAHAAKITVCGISTNVIHESNSPVLELKKTMKQLGADKFVNCVDDSYGFVFGAHFADENGYPGGWVVVNFPR